MDKIKVAVCDDNKNIFDILCSTLRSIFEKHDVIAEIEVFSSCVYLEKSMKHTVFDVLFLDIEMPELDGIAFGEYLRSRNDNTDIIFISAREDKVFDTFNIHPFGFVRKSNFLQDIEKIVSNYINTRSRDRGKAIALNSKSGIMNIPLASIKYIEGNGKSQLMHLVNKDEPISVYRTMQTLEEEFENDGFIRIHKGFLVNYKYISGIMAAALELIDGTSLPIGRKTASGVKEKYLLLLKNDKVASI